jgi:hypothetical protein
MRGHGNDGVRWAAGDISHTWCAPPREAPLCHLDWDRGVVPHACGIGRARRAAGAAPWPCGGKLLQRPASARHGAVSLKGVGTTRTGRQNRRKGCSGRAVYDGKLPFGEEPAHGHGWGTPSRFCGQCPKTKLASAPTGSSAPDFLRQLRVLIGVDRSSAVEILSYVHPGAAANLITALTVIS